MTTKNGNAQTFDTKQQQQTPITPGFGKTRKERRALPSHQRHDKAQSQRPEPKTERVNTITIRHNSRQSTKVIQKSLGECTSIVVLMTLACPSFPNLANKHADDHHIIIVPCLQRRHRCCCDCRVFLVLFFSVVLTAVRIAADRRRAETVEKRKKKKQEPSTRTTTDTPKKTHTHTHTHTHAQQYGIPHKEHDRITLHRCCCSRASGKGEEAPSVSAGRCLFLISRPKLDLAC